MRRTWRQPAWSTEPTSTTLLGMSRAVRVMAQATLQDGNTMEAFEQAIAAACINPYGTPNDHAQLLTLIEEIMLACGASKASAATNKL